MLIPEVVKKELTAFKCVSGAKMHRSKLQDGGSVCDPLCVYLKRDMYI